MKTGRLRVTIDTRDNLDSVLAELVALGIVEPDTIRRREGRGHVWYGYARLAPQFS